MMTPGKASWPPLLLSWLMAGRGLASVLVEHNTPAGIGWITISVLLWIGAEIRGAIVWVMARHPGTTPAPRPRMSTGRRRG